MSNKVVADMLVKLATNAENYCASTLEGRGSDRWCDQLIETLIKHTPAMNAPAFQLPYQKTCKAHSHSVDHWQR